MLDHGVNLALGGQLRPILYVEREAFCVCHLATQMEAATLATAPVWSDAKKLTHPTVSLFVRRALGGRPLDLMFGGIPCQPWSVAGKRGGKHYSRDLWPGVLAAIGEYEPGCVFIENVSGFTKNAMGLGRVRDDLENLGYRVAAGLFSSAEMCANHRRERCFVMADCCGKGLLERQGQQENTCQEQQTTERSCDSVANPNIPDGRKHIQGRGQERRVAVDGAGEGMADTHRLWELQPKRCISDKRRRPENCNKAVVNTCNDLGRSQQIGALLAGLTVSGDGLADTQGPNGRGKQSEEKHGKRRGGPSRECENLSHYAPGPSDWPVWERVSQVAPALMPCIESKLRGMADGLAPWVHCLAAIGNGVDPLVAAYAFVTLAACLRKRR